MKKRVVGFLSAGVILLSVIGVMNSNQSSQLDTVQTGNTSTATKNTPKKITPICDGTSVISACSLDGVNYKTYIYHPATPEKSHMITETTYKEEVTGYCTLCNDGTYSPSCATGRGACSYHGGVAQWNAPRTRNVPVYNTRTVIDAAAQGAYYEKVIE
jgi:hypothetical protein